MTKTGLIIATVFFGGTTAFAGIASHKGMGANPPMSTPMSIRQGSAGTGTLATSAAAAYLFFGPKPVHKPSSSSTGSSRSSTGFGSSRSHSSGGFSFGK